MDFWLIGGSALFREAMMARLDKAGIGAIDQEPHPDRRQRTVVVAFCNDDDSWRRLEALDGYLGRTAVIEHLDIDLYRRALRSRLGVVHIDTTSENIVSVAEASARHEVVLPAEIGHRLADGFNGTPAEASTLDSAEIDLIRSIAQGETLASLAEQRFFSERTLRRRLQSIYLKLGVQDRINAIRVADKLGLIDVAQC